MSAILSFLGGSAFRAIWGEISSYVTKRQDAKLELARLTLQGQLDAASHARQMEMVKLQHDMGVDQIRVQSAADLEKYDADVFKTAIDKMYAPSGVKWVDAWNGGIRPAFGTLALGFVIFLCWQAGPDLDKLRALGVAEVMFSVIGFYFADRSLKKAGK